MLYYKKKCNRVDYNYGRIGLVTQTYDPNDIECGSSSIEYDSGVAMKKWHSYTGEDIRNDVLYTNDSWEIF